MYYIVREQNRHRIVPIIKVDREFPRFSIFYIVVAGIVNTEGALWKDQRRFLHDKLRSFGMTSGAGKKNLESRIMVSEQKFVLINVRSVNLLHL